MLAQTLPQHLGLRGQPEDLIPAALRSSSVIT
jgi:hypothetical protein